MSKGAYVGVNGVARKIKKGYIGVDGVARKIIKAYIGVGGVARPCWGGGELTHYGTITPLWAARYALAGATVGKHALFAGGFSSAAINYRRVDGYNEALTREEAPYLSAGRARLAGATVGSYAIFAGGYTATNSATFVVDAYDEGL